MMNQARQTLLFPKTYWTLGFDSPIGKSAKHHLQFGLQVCMPSLSFLTMAAQHRKGLFVHNLEGLEKAPPVN